MRPAGLAIARPFPASARVWGLREGSLSYPSPYEHPERGHIAQVIEKGHWAEP